MKTIVVFGAGKSATVLIDYLIKETEKLNWKCIIADANKEQVLLKTQNAPSSVAVEIDINHSTDRAALIQSADVVISLMPPTLHILIAKDCLKFNKHLLTASYIDPAIKALEQDINDKGLLFICEMGLDPGIDHMRAMKMIDEIKSRGGKIESFKSHCGGLIAPESDDNPWHYKISWNPRNVVMAGQAGAEFKVDNTVQQWKYEQLFENCSEVKLEGLPDLAYYPNRDSLSYIPLYHLTGVHTFIRTTLRYPAFCKGWNAVVKAGLADDKTILDTRQMSFKQWSLPIEPFVNDENREMLTFLGFFDETPVPPSARNGADILQFLLENKLVMKSKDKDMIVMLHEIEYTLDQKNHRIQSSLIVKGEDNLRTAMAKTVGLPLGIAAVLILKNEIQLKGLHIPTVKEIYIPVLAALETAGVRFNEKEND